MKNQPEALRLADDEVLRVTEGGQFIWHENADEMIKNGDFSAMPAMLHILRALQQRDALLEALKLLIDMDIAYKRGSVVEDAVDRARAAIKAAEGS